MTFWRFSFSPSPCPPPHNRMLSEPLAKRPPPHFNSEFSVIVPVRVSFCLFYFLRFVCHHLCRRSLSMFVIFIHPQSFILSIFIVFFCSFCFKFVILHYFFATGVAVEIPFFIFPPAEIHTHTWAYTGYDKRMLTSLDRLKRSHGFK